MSRRSLQLLALSLALCASACAMHQTRWQAALARAQRSYDAGHYAQALAESERAQGSTRPDSAVVAQAMELRAKAYEKLGQREQAEAHYRYIVDQCATSAQVAAARAAVARLEQGGGKNAKHAGGDSLAEWGFLQEVVLEYPEIHYPDLAVDLGLGGTVVVAFQVNEDGQPSRIRVLSTPHPLLSGAAIDAVARSRVDPEMFGLTDRSMLPALRQTKVKFEFQ